MALQRIGLEAVLDLSQFNRAYNDYLNKLNHMNRETGSTANNLSGKFLGLGNSLLSIAAILSGVLVAAAGVAAVALGKMVISGITEAADLEQSVANIAAVLGITADEAGFLKDVILDLGIDPTLRVSTEEAGQALHVLAQAGIFNNQTMAEMKVTAENAGKAVVMLANATGADFDQAAAIATDAMTLFNKSGDEMIDVVSHITGVTNMSKFTINDYELAMRNGGATAALYGVSLEDLNVVIAASAEELGNGRRAGTGFMNFLNRLTPNTEKAKDLMAELGWIVNGSNQFFDEATGEMKDMRDIAVMLTDTLYGETAVVREVGGRTAEQTAILEQMVAEYRKAEETVFNYTVGADSLLATEDEKNDALNEAYEVMGKLGPTINELNGIHGEYNLTLEKMSAEQRAVTLETLFGNDGMKTAIALANEGAQANLTVAQTMEIFGVNMAEANAMMADGITNWDVLNAGLNDADAVENATTRTDTLKAKWENLKDVWTAFKIRALDPVRQAIEDFITNTLFPAIQGTGDFALSLSDLGDKIGLMVETILKGEPPFTTFLDFLKEIGHGDAADKLQLMATKAYLFILPIKEFVEKHKDGFIGALRAIGTLMVAATLAAIASAVWSLVTGVGGLIAVVGLLGFAWTENWGNIQGVTETAVTNITKSLKTLGVLDFFSKLKEGFDENGLQGIADAVPGAFRNLGQRVSELISNIDWVSIGMTLRERLFSAMENLGELAGEAFNWFYNLFTNIDWATVGKTIVDLVIGWLAINFIVTETILEAVYNFFKGLFSTIDWDALADWFFGGMLFDALVGVLGGMWDEMGALGEAYIVPALAEWGLVFLTWFTEQKENVKIWATENIVDPIVNGLKTFGETVATTLGEWWTAINTWFTETITWENLGYWVTTAILTALLDFPLKVIAVLGTWWTAIDTWWDGIEWGTLGQRTIDKVKAVFDTWWLGVKITFDALWTGITTWWNGIRWEQLGEKTIDTTKSVFDTWWLGVKITFEALWTAITTWWDGVEWDTLGQRVIDGAIAGINSRWQSLIQTVSDIAEGAKQAWDDFWDTHSPSVVMLASGQDIMQGAILGIQSSGNQMVQTFQDIFGNVWGYIVNLSPEPIVNHFRDIFSGIEDIFAFGSGLSGIAGGFTSAFQTMVIDPAKAAQAELIASMETTLATVSEQLNTSATDYGLSSPLTDEQIQRIADTGMYLDEDGLLLHASEQMIEHAQRLLTLQQQITLEKERTLAEEQQLLNLQKQQQDFAFLQQQMDLLKFIDENGLNAADLLGGLELGLDANISALVEAMTQAMQAVVIAAEEELQISSPSAVFMGIGEQMMAGLARGLEVGNVLSAAQSRLGNFVSSVGNLLPNVRAGNNVVSSNQTTNTYQVNNSFTGNPQITDANTLQRTLAGFA